jgi:hypothetical protein
LQGGKHDPAAAELTGKRMSGPPAVFYSGEMSKKRTPSIVRQAKAILFTKKLFSNWLSDHLAPRFYFI